ncbi:Destroys superoxide radical to produce hydrogen peroxide [Ectocarpus siliculosus]|uniref:Superoxide dismutase n=1 Tax=Ectocarpus siliculosus TaxID=2880 RepID=D7FQ23_ECTSI|nr:Destroys superoxide radical to produce hydrogen peroxide [Ectocarpus siliculosus]|eukprot:CBJ48355.1 Destroys superoxide radical to produce hydrogen peroxide [Ectocarpus siliculosus]
MMFSRVACNAARRVPSAGRMISSSAAARAPAVLPDLTYDYGELEPAISGEIMKIHHTKHHQAYINNLNAAMEKLADAEAKGDVTAILQLQAAIKFNGGGHLNHSIFWKNLAPVGKGGGEMVTGTLADMIEAQYHSMGELTEKMSAASVGVQGSGWGWLGYDKVNKRLAIATCANQDPLEATTGLVPLLGIDVWEHAYYLQYKNVRPDYVKSIFKVVNWADVQERLTAATS